MQNEILKFFKQIKLFIQTYFYQDYKIIAIAIFIFISLFYKYFQKFKTYNYIINASVVDVKKNGQIVLKKNYHDYEVYIKDMPFPKRFDSCASDFRYYFVLNLKNYFSNHKDIVDVKIIKKHLFSSYEGYFYVQNENIKNYIDNIIFLKNIIPKEKETDWCYILEKAHFKRENFIKYKIKNLSEKIKLIKKHDIFQ